MYISLKDQGNIMNVLRNWPKRDAARISVVTDGSRILGLGDLGVNGMPISIGKLSLYIAGAGYVHTPWFSYHDPDVVPRSIRPESTMPICLDLGTNNQKFLDDPLYLGLRQRRVGDDVMDAFMDEFMHAMSTLFPKLLLQFEDFSTDHAFAYLKRFRHKYPVFNDDIQGTGGVVLSGFLNAAKLSSAASSLPLSSHKILFLGAGSAGVGVAQQLMSFFTLQGLTAQEARERVWFVDSQGLIFDARGPMAEHKKYFSRKDYSGPPMTNLLDIIEYVKPTALLGLSTQKGAFNKDVITTMAGLNPRPIIFPLSNPVRLSECEFHEAVEWTDGHVVFASGSPFPEQQYKGRTHYPGQGNNMYIFPGLGLGAILARASQVTDSMVEAASLALANSLNAEERALEMIYPRIERIRDISAEIAFSVVRMAQQENVDRSPDLKTMSDAELMTFVKSKMWRPW